MNTLCICQEKKIIFFLPYVNAKHSLCHQLSEIIEIHFQGVQTACVAGISCFYYHYIVKHANAAVYIHLTLFLLHKLIHTCYVGDQSVQI